MRRQPTKLSPGDLHSPDPFPKHNPAKRDDKLSSTPCRNSASSHPEKLHLSNKALLYQKCRLVIFRQTRIASTHSPFQIHRYGTNEWTYSLPRKPRRSAAISFFLLSLHSVLLSASQRTCPVWGLTNKISTQSNKHRTGASCRFAQTDEFKIRQTYYQSDRRRLPLQTRCRARLLILSL